MPPRYSTSTSSRYPAARPVYKRTFFKKKAVKKPSYKRSFTEKKRRYVPSSKLSTGYWPTEVKLKDQALMKMVTRWASHLYMYGEALLSPPLLCV